MYILLRVLFLNLNNIYKLHLNRKIDNDNRYDKTSDEIFIKVIIKKVIVLKDRNNNL